MSIIKCILKFGIGLNLIFAAQVSHALPQPQFKKVIMIVLENTDYNDAVKLPYLSQLVSQGALFTNFYAEKHPSQPNYIAMIAGDPLGVSKDALIDLPDDSSHQTIVDLLEKKGMSWKAYAENYPGNCFLGKSSGKYVRKHVPFLSFKSVQNHPSRCAKVVNDSELDRDISNQTLPDYSFYVPNLDNDGHDTNPAFADQWLAHRFGALFSDANFMKDTLVVITFDESEALFGLFGNNKIFNLFIGANVIPGSSVSIRMNHYSILKTIEDTFGLGNLCKGDASATGIYDIWR